MQHSAHCRREAFICTYECTFCASCAQAMHSICPNCGGELVPVPAASKARQVTGSGQKRHQRVNRSSPEVRSHTNGTLYRTRLPPLPPRRNQTLPQGQPSASPRNAPSRSATSPPASTASPARSRRSSATVCSFARSRRPSASTSPSRPSSAPTTRRPPTRPASPANSCSSSLRPVSTTSPTVSASR